MSRINAPRVMGFAELVKMQQPKQVVTLPNYNNNNNGPLTGSPVPSRQSSRTNNLSRSQSPVPRGKRVQGGRPRTPVELTNYSVYKSGQLDFEQLSNRLKKVIGFKPTSPKQSEKKRSPGSSMTSSRSSSASSSNGFNGNYVYRGKIGTRRPKRMAANAINKRLRLIEKRNPGIIEQQKQELANIRKEEKARRARYKKIAQQFAININGRNFNSNLAFVMAFQKFVKNRDPRGA